ncbi:flippase [Candidatus Uhrbacteria bacterium]|nr:flippase [Candidatus Uhrbacteria bacterium]
MEHTARKIVANTFLFTGTLMIQKVISFLYFWFLSAQLSPALLGSYIWALSFVGVFSIGIDLGLSPLLIREAARDPKRSERLLRAVLGLKILFTIGTLALLLLVLFISRRDFVTMLVVMVGVLVILTDSFTMSFYSILRARQNIRYESMGMLGFQILVFALGAYLLGIARSPILAMTALAVGSLANLLYAWSVVRFRVKFRTSPIFEREIVDVLLRLLPAFAVSGIFVRLYNVSDALILGYLVDETAVGLYSVPAKVMTALQMLIPGAFVASIYPAMSHYFKTDRTMLERLFERSVGYLLILVLPIMVALFVLGPFIIRTIWPAYDAIIPTFLLMAIALPFLFLSFPTGYLLNAVDRERTNTTNRGIVTVVNVILNLSLIRTFGVLGAGISFLVSTTLLFILDIWNVRQVIPFEWRWLRVVILKAGIGGLAMGVVLFFMHEKLSLAFLAREKIFLVVLVLAGFLVYAALMLVLRTFSRSEFRMVLDMVRKKSETPIPHEL